MYEYTLTQWLMMFYIYCFAGWVWESCYVSVKSKKWVNRGFMHGPFLPIYGSGAIVVLLVTLPVQNNIGLVIVFGMVAATLLEYVTGACMERMFHVRYWDYSNQKLNVHGYICASSTVAWGAFSVLMIKVIQPPVQDLVLSIPEKFLQIATYGLTIGVVIDMTQSFNEAMDLRAALTKLAESNEELQKLQKRMESVAATAEENIQDYLEKRRENEQIKEEKKLSRRASIEANLEASKQKKINQLKGFTDMLTNYADKINLPEVELNELKAKIVHEAGKIQGRTSKEYMRAIRMLRRNPGASVSAASQKEALKQVFELDRYNKKK